MSLERFNRGSNPLRRLNAVVDAVNALPADRPGPATHLRHGFWARLLTEAEGLEGRYTFEECFLDGDGAWQAVPDGRGTGESDIADEANELSGLCAGGATPAVWIWQFNDDAGYRRYVFEAAEGGLRWGFAAAAWESGNTVTITPCVGAEDNTPTGQDDVTGYLTLPVGGAPDESLTPVIEEGDILGYLRFGEDEGLLPGIKWAAAAGGEGGEGLSVSAWVDVDGEGSKIRTISTADWRSRMVVYHIAWGQEPLQGGEFPNSETGQRVIYTADSTQPYVFTKSAGNDAVAAFIDGTDGGKLKLEIDKGNPQSYMHLFYWVRSSDYHPDPTT